jgi:hypothetical protein
LFSSILPCKSCKSSKGGCAQKCEQKVAKSDCGCGSKRSLFRRHHGELTPVPMIDEPIFEENPFEDDTLQAPLDPAPEAPETPEVPEVPTPTVQAQETLLPIAEPLNQTAAVEEKIYPVQPASFHFKPVVTMVSGR